VESGTGTGSDQIEPGVEDQAQLQPAVSERKRSTAAAIFFIRWYHPKDSRHGRR
jgi:hypothetical protein